MKYQNIEITKKESEVIKFIQTGENSFWNAYYNYESRKKRIDRPTQTISSWFNRVIKSLHDKGLFKDIPFVLYFKAERLKFIWMNPGINASRANYQAITLHDAIMDQKREINKII